MLPINNRVPNLRLQSDGEQESKQVKLAHPASCEPAVQSLAAVGRKGREPLTEASDFPSVPERPKLRPPRQPC